MLPWPLSWRRVEGEETLVVLCLGGEVRPVSFPWICHVPVPSVPWFLTMGRVLCWLPTPLVL